MRLAPAALTLRAVHTVITVAFLAAILHVWWCAITGRRGRLLRVAVVALAGEGLLVAANHGDCPLGGLQQRAGDPIPLFELVLSPRAARYAVPLLGAVASTGIALLARPPHHHRPSSTSIPHRQRPSTRRAYAPRFARHSRSRRARNL